MTTPGRRSRRGGRSGCRCRKRWYPDKVGAMLALADIERKDRPQARECREYPCPTSRGYHLTSQSTR